MIFKGSGQIYNKLKTKQINLEHEKVLHLVNFPNKENR